MPRLFFSPRAGRVRVAFGMKIIDRYIGSSVIATAFFGVVVLSLVLVLGNLFKQLLDVLINNPDVPIATVLAFMALVLPFSLTFTIPWGFLTALLLVFGRISADNELVALKSNGVSVPRICIPVFVLAVAAFGDLLLDQHRGGASRRAADDQDDCGYRHQQSRGPLSRRPGRGSIPGPPRLCRAKEGDRLKNLIVFELNENNEPIKMVYAKEGVLTPDPANTRLLFRLFNARFEERDKQDPRDLTKIRQGIEVTEGVFPISLEEFYKEYLSGRRLSSYTLPELLGYLPTITGEEKLTRERGTSQTLRRVTRLRGFRADCGAARHYGSPQGNLCRFRPQPGDRVYLLLFHYHGGHFPRKPGCASDPAHLDSERPLYHAGHRAFLAAVEEIEKTPCPPGHFVIAS